MLKELHPHTYRLLTRVKLPYYFKGENAFYHFSGKLKAAKTKECLTRHTLNTNRTCTALRRNRRINRSSLQPSQQRTHERTRGQCWGISSSFHMKRPHPHISLLGHLRRATKVLGIAKPPIPSAAISSATWRFIGVQQQKDSAWQRRLLGGYGTPPWRLLCGWRRVLEQICGPFKEDKREGQPAAPPNQDRPIVPILSFSTQLQ